MRLRFALLVVVVACAGCTRHAFLDERRTAPYAGLLERGAAFERQTDRIPSALPGETGLAVAVEHVTSSSRRADRLLVFVGGVFCTRSTWRFVVAPLAAEYDLLLVDPPGCGESDKPDPGGPATGRYTPEWMAGHELRAVGAWRHARGDRRPVTLIGHSMGSAVCLRMLSEPALAGHAVVGCVDSLVLISPPDVVVEDASALLQDAVTASDFEVKVAQVLGLFCHRVSDAVWDIHYDPHRNALRQDVLGMARAMGTPSTRHASQAMLARYNPMRPDGTLDRSRVGELRRNAAAVDVPVLVLHGEADRTVPPENGRELVARLPRAELRVVPHARHSPHGERASWVADAILDFLRTGQRRPSQSSKPWTASATQTSRPQGVTRKLRTP